MDGVPRAAVSLATTNSAKLGAGNIDPMSGVVPAVVFGNDVLQVAVGDRATCVVKEGGTVACVGAIPRPQSFRTATPVPVTPPGLERDVDEVVPFCAR
jgi:hypothetical protein